MRLLPVVMFPVKGEARMKVIWLLPKVVFAVKEPLAMVSS